MIHSMKNLQFSFVIKPVIILLRLTSSRSEKYGFLQTLWWFFMLTCNITWIILSCVQLNHTDDMQEFFQIFLNINALIQALAAQIAARVYEYKIKEILNTIHREFWFDEEKYDKELYAKHSYYYKLLSKLTKTYQVVCFICITVWLLNPSLISARKFAMDMTFPYNNFIKRSPYFEVTFVVMIITIIPISVCTAFQDTLYCACLTSAICQINFIKHKLQMLITKESEFSEEKIYNGLKECIDHHNLILHFLKEVEMMYRYLMLNKFVCDIACLLGVRLALSTGNNLTIKLLFILLISGIQPLMYCVFGDIITSKCDSIGQQAYTMSWENLRYKKVRYAVIMIIQRSYKPVLMTAGGMIVLCLPNYIAFIRMIFSFYVLLENMNN